MFGGGPLQTWGGHYRHGGAITDMGGGGGATDLVLISLLHLLHLLLIHFLEIVCQTAGNSGN